MARLATGKDIRQLAWILGGSLVAAIVFAFVLYRSIQSDFEEAGVSSPASEPSEGARFADRQTAAFEELLTGFVADVREGRTAAAYERTATAYRAGVPPDRFEDGVRANAWLPAAQGVSVHRLQFREGTARVEAVLRTTTGNVDLVAHFTEESRVWKLTGLLLGGTPALPGPGASPAAAVPSVVVVANPAEARDVADAASPLERWRGCAAEDVDPVELGMLESILSGEPYRDDAADAFTPLGEHSADGPFVFRIPDRLVARLARLTATESRRVGSRWARIEELRAEEWSEADAVRFVGDLVSLARTARSEGKALLLRASL